LVREIGCYSIPGTVGQALPSTVRFDCMLVWKYDRFTRSLGALITALAEFNELGIDFISHSQSIDTTTALSARRKIDFSCLPG
jgi:DNA invertase Pin-like site-specific DNA recombinase